MDLLVANGAHLEARDSQRETPLFCAVNRSNNRITETLLRNGAKTEVTNIDGQIPLFYVNSAYVIALLSKYGANFEARDYNE